MTPTSKRVLFWTPRILCIVFAAFLSIFAADVFSERLPFWTTMGALLMHLIPSALVLLMLALAWRHEWFGGLVSIALGVLQLVLKWGQLPFIDFLIVAGPLFLIASLFFANWWLLRRPGASGTAAA